MKSYNELTRLGQLRRLRQLAEVALDAYGLTNSRLVFLHYEGNVVFRVDAQHPAVVVDKVNPYVPNRYVLRILSISDADTIRSELTWLAALRRDAGLSVPEPIPTLGWKLLIPITTPGVPHGRVVTLLRWVDGRRLIKGRCPTHVRALGRLMAELHRFAADWQPPEGFKRFHWDWDGLMGETGLGHPIDELVSSMPKQYQKPVAEVSDQVQAVMESFGKGSDAYGMIFADMYMENVLFKAEEPRAIDFEDCGFGYWMYDIGTLMSQCWWTEERERFREAFLEGHSRVLSLSESQLAHLELFVATQYAVALLWSSAFIKHDPARRAAHEKWREKEGNNLLRCFAWR
ncbi:MAG: hypothetical protein AMJ88_18185 [Anaerolineae bacterium SM23_ 63]|nr:MAG: hypothetical protein AMJ88_18185 [Anaerolineae bacterium SM23_ 63]